MTFPSLSDSISVNDSQADEELVENLKNWKCYKIGVMDGDFSRGERNDD